MRVCAYGVRERERERVIHNEYHTIHHPIHISSSFYLKPSSSAPHFTFVTLVPLIDTEHTLATATSATYVAISI